MNRLGEFDLDSAVKPGMFASIPITLLSLGFPGLGTIVGFAINRIFGAHDHLAEDIYNHAVQYRDQFYLPIAAKLAAHDYSIGGFIPPNDKDLDIVLGTGYALFGSKVAHAFYALAFGHALETGDTAPLQRIAAAVDRAQAAAAAALFYYAHAPADTTGGGE
jgi:hypothetical protein